MTFSKSKIAFIFALTLITTASTFFIQSLTSRQTNTRQHAASANTTKLGPNGTILINNAPIFLHGFYQDADDPAHQGNFLLNDMNTISSLGYNLMHPTLTEFSNTTLYRQQAPGKGIWTIAQFYQPALTTVVNTLKTDPGVIAYDIGDDFNLPLNDPKKTPAIYEQKAATIRSLVSHQLTYGAGTGFPGFPLATYKNAFDIIGIEAYPISNKDPSFQTEMEESIQYYIYARTQLPDRAVFALPQTFMWDDTSRLPTPLELRNMAWGSLIAKVNGILYYSYYCCGTHIPSTALMPEVQKLGFDIAKVTPALLASSPTIYDASTIGITDRTGRVRAGFWRVNNVTTVIIVNTATSSKTVSIPLPANTTGTLTSLFPSDTRYGSNLTITNGKITGTVANYGIHAYQITSPVSPTFTPSAGNGDFNSDTKIDLLDFNIWRNEFLALITSKLSDANTDTLIDLLDFNIWLNSFRAQT